MRKLKIFLAKAKIKRYQKKGKLPNNYRALVRLIRKG
jgi:hypothetical protein